MTHDKNYFAARILSTVIGGAIGDALGVPVEFKGRDTFKITGMTGYGTHDQPPGTWSDDTSLTLCLMENIIEGGKKQLWKNFKDAREKLPDKPVNVFFEIWSEGVSSPAWVWKKIQGNIKDYNHNGGNITEGLIYVRLGNKEELHTWNIAEMIK